MHSFILQIYQKYTLGGKVLLLTYSDWVTHTDTHPRPAIDKKMVSHLTQIRLPFFFFPLSGFYCFSKVCFPQYSHLLLPSSEPYLCFPKNPHTT